MSPFEDIAMAEVSHQVIVSAWGDLIAVKRVAEKAGAAQILGAFSESSFQKALHEDKAKDSVSED